MTLAFWESTDIDTYLEAKLETFTPETVVDPRSIHARLESLRKGEPLWTHGEYVEGISSVAAPIRNERGHAVAALYVYGPSYRFPPDTAAGVQSAHAIAQSVTRRAIDISLDLGWIESDRQSNTTTRRGAA